MVDQQQPCTGQLSRRRVIAIARRHDAGTARRRAPVQSALASAGSTSAVRVGFLGGARMVLPVPDLACAGGDALALERMIEKVPGVLRAYVNPATENAYIDYAPDRVTSAAIGAKVRELGYGAKASAR